MPRAVSLHPPPGDEGYTEEQRAYISHVRTAHSCPSITHVCRGVCNSPTRSAVPLIRSHFRSSWVRSRPFWCHLPLTRRTFTLPGDPTYAYARVHTQTHTGVCAHRRCGKVLQVTAGVDERTRGCGGDGGAAEGRDGRAYSGIQRAARGRR